MVGGVMVSKVDCKHDWELRKVAYSTGGMPRHVVSHIYECRKCRVVGLPVVESVGKSAMDYIYGDDDE